MDATLLTRDSFWDEKKPVAIAAPGKRPPVLTKAPPLVFFQTSGSMGKPRWVGLSRHALEYSAMMVNARLQVDENSVWGLALPLHHVGGMGVVARAHEAGCGLELFSQNWQEHNFVGWVENHKVTHTSLVPTQLHDIVLGGLRAPNCLKAVVVGGGQLNEETGETARGLGWPILTSYGMTEAGSQIATQGMECLRQFYSNAPIEKLAHWEWRIADNGCLAIKGEALFDGILTKKEDEWVYQQRESDWFVTNDRAELSDAGMTYLGRADLRVKVLGELVNLEQVEERLAFFSFHRIRRDSVVVLALPDARAGNKLVPVFDATLGMNVVQDVMRTYRNQICGVERLQEPVLLEDFPRTELGKPKRALIQNMVGAA